MKGLKQTNKQTKKLQQKRITNKNIYRTEK